MTYPFVLTLTRKTLEKLQEFIFTTTGYELEDLVRQDPRRAYDLLEAVASGATEKFNRMGDTDDGRIIATSRDDGAEAIQNYAAQSLSLARSRLDTEGVEVTINVRRKPTLKELVSGKFDPSSPVLSFIVEPPNLAW